MIMENRSSTKQAMGKIEILHTELVSLACTLEITGQEMVQSTYTEPHDLRSHLSSLIHDYFEVLIDLAVENIDEHCKGYLQDVVIETVKLTRLLDTLINVSSLIHRDLYLQLVDLRQLTNTISSELILLGCKKVEAVSADEQTAGLQRFDLINESIRDS